MTTGRDSFGGRAVPAAPTAMAFAEAVLELLAAKTDLERAMHDVPTYTAQWRDEDYYQTELERYNRAADRLWACVTSDQN